MHYAHYGYSHRRRRLWIIIIAILALIAAAYAIQNQKIISFIKLNSYVVETCEQKVEKLIPKEITLRKMFDGDKLRPMKFKWNDGVEAWAYYEQVYFRKGDKVGENTLLYYQKRDSIINPGHEDYFAYSTDVIDETGVLKGYNKFAVKFILQERDEAMKEDAERYADGSLKFKYWHKPFIINQTTIAYCQWLR